MVALAAALALACSVAVNAVAEKPVVLTADTQFQVKQLVPDLTNQTIIVRQVQESGGNLYFLINARRSGSLILRTDLGGSLLTTINLRQRIASAFDFDSDGGLYVLAADENNRHGLFFYDSSGKDTPRVTADRLTGPIATFRILDDLPMILTIDGSIRRSRIGGSPAVRLPRGNAMSLADLPDGRFVAADQATASLYLGNPDIGIQRHFRLAAPEIESAREKNRNRPEPPEGRRTGEYLLLRNLATDQSGNFYVTVSTFSIADGAPILQFDESGRLLRRFRCKLPERHEGGSVFPSHLVVTSDYVVVVDTRGTVLRFKTS